MFVDPRAEITNLARGVEGVIHGVGTTGVVPFSRCGSIWLVEHTIEGIDGAATTLSVLLSAIDVLAAQTTMIKENGAQRTTGGEAAGLHRQAADLRVCRRAITVLRQEIARSCSKRGGAR